MLAASGGHVKVVQVLLHYRASSSDGWPLNREHRGSNSRRSTALHSAAAGGHIRTVDVLLGAGFDRQQKDSRGEIPAELSARMSHSTSAAVTRLLLPKGDKGGELLYNRVHALMENVAIVSGLVKGGAFLDWQDNLGETPLHRAVRFGYAATTKILLRAGANPNLRGCHGAFPLQIAACTGRGEMVADLLDYGAEKELLMDECPLLRAVWNNEVNVVGLLLDAGAAMERRDDLERQSPLSWACKGCLAPIVRVLVEAGADVESRCGAGLTPLHWACRFVDVESVELLLNAGADPGAVEQAAADAVAISSSSSGTSVSKCVAIDVIGLGFPLNCVKGLMDSLDGGSVGLAARRLDLASVTRIESALQVATQKYCWRRRGWLVMLNNRCVVMKLSAVRDRWWADCSSGYSRFTPVAVQSRCVHTDVEHLPYTQQERAATGSLVSASTKEYCSDGSVSRHPQAYLSNGQNNVGKRLRVAESMTMTAIAMCRQKYQTCRGIGTGEDVGEVLFSDVVDALLELATVEVGVFRRVVMFI